MKFCLRILVAIYDCAVFYLGMLQFGLSTLIWTMFAVVLRPLMPRDASRRLGRFAIMAIFRSFLFTLQLSGRFRFDLAELDSLKNEKSLIIAPNHPSLWDAVLIVSRLPDVACVMKAELIGNVFLGAGARLARYIRNESVRRMIMLAVAELGRGNRILLFPEGTRTMRHPVNPFKRSLGVIACRAKAPVQTVFIETDSPFLAKGWPVYRKPRLPMRYRVRLGRRFEPGDDSIALMAELEQYFNAEMSASPWLPTTPLASPGTTMALAE
ncbi:MAG: 1-acyl-sn-glycerol-3-phosphate acyltransferase [Noviherbaspirillum sp.]|nr:1-acyl-sn-glycerol-3-phosphate acyltransferase [Noviherbaspirillum sp.]